MNPATFKTETMRRLFPILCLLAAIAGARIAPAQEPPLAPEVNLVPGIKPTPWLRYVNPTATAVEVSGTWNQWTRGTPMIRTNNQFILDVRKLPVPRPGRYEFKFVANGSWEVGDNRTMFINDDRVLERPPDVVMSARLDGRDEINVYLKQPVDDERRLAVRLEPDVPVRSVRVVRGLTDVRVRGYVMAGGVIKFLLDEKIYGLNLKPADVVSVAGNFNDWNGGGGRFGIWRLHDDDDDGLWELAIPYEGLNFPEEEHYLFFRFVLDQHTWLPAPRQAPNGVADRNGNVNLKADPQEPGATVLQIVTEQPLNLSESYNLVMDGVADRRVRHVLSPGRVLDTLLSTKDLGARLDREHGVTTYRLFAPRASRVYLNLFATPEYEQHTPTYRRMEPAERYPMWKDEADGVWELSLLGLDAGRYYAFSVDGPTGDGEAFNGLAFLGDPYALAAAHSQNNTIVIDPEATNQWFEGWTDQAWRAPAHEDVLIYEAHVRDLTIHPSSGVAPQLRGTYAGLLASLGTGTGLDHIRALGCNMVELLPVSEFENSTRDYGWGYNSVYFFSPEASYGRQPLKGSQYYEFKNLVNGMHRAGLGVIMDVVFNHVGGPNVFSLIDKKYFFRLTPDYRHLNFSGCGNDVKSEAPMMRRLIVDNILYWMREHKVDGFRFDLAELIDLKTLMTLRDEARKLNPDVLLIAEPWSLRAQNKEQLRGTGWAAWNNDFRYAAKDFARGRADREWLKRTIVGSVDIWTENPMQAVNYVESHDDMALVDELSLRPDRNGKYVQSYEVSMNKLAVTILFTSLGIPMINEGQEFLRSKYGISNTFDKGDAVNALRWSDRERPLAAETMSYYRDLMTLRQSEEGAAFRVRQRAPDSYYQWINPATGRAVGYIVNAPRVHKGNGFVVLANGSDELTPFTFTLPAGQWRVIGDGSHINRAGLPNFETLAGPRPTTIKVPPMRSLILMDGF